MHDSPTRYKKQVSFLFRGTSPSLYYAVRARAGTSDVHVHEEKRDIMVLHWHGRVFLCYGELPAIRQLLGWLYKEDQHDGL